MRTSEAKNIPFNQIYVDPSKNSRTNLTDIERLAKSIQRHGLLEPIIVTNGGGGDKPYKLHAGFRRYAALASLGWTAPVLCVVREHTKDSSTRDLIENLVENSERVEVPSADRAVRFAALVSGDIEGVKISREDLAEEVGLSKSQVNNMIRCAQKLHKNVLELWAKANLPDSLVFRIASMPEELQEAEANIYLKKREKLEAEGRERAPRGESGEESGDDTGNSKPTAKAIKDALSVLSWKRGTVSKTEAKIIDDQIFVVALATMKTNEDLNALEEFLSNEAFQALRFLIGDLTRFPGITAEDRKGYEKYLDEQKEIEKAAKKAEKLAAKAEEEAKAPKKAKSKKSKAEETEEEGAEG